MKVSEESSVSCLLDEWAEWMEGGNRVFPNHFVPCQVNISDPLLAKGAGVNLEPRERAAQLEMKISGDRSFFQVGLDRQPPIHNTEAILN